MQNEIPLPYYLQQHEITKTQLTNFSQISNLPNKNTVTIVQENHFLITIIPLDKNHPTEKTIAEDLQMKEFHEISHKLDIVDQTVRTINIERTIQDQTQTEVTTQFITKIVQTPIPLNVYYSNDRSRNSSYNKNRN